MHISLFGLRYKDSWDLLHCLLEVEPNSPWRLVMERAMFKNPMVLKLILTMVNLNAARLDDTPIMNMKLSRVGLFL